jgi:hypothetical protein
MSLNCQAVGSGRGRERGGAWGRHRGGVGEWAGARQATCDEARGN